MSASPYAHAEPRWPVAVAILVAVFLLAVLPDRLRLVPAWGLWIAGAIVLAPMIAVGISAGTSRWLRVERIVTLLFVALVTIGTVTSLAYLVRVILRGSTEVRGLELLSSSIGVWVTNVLAFSLLYWQVDRGGPGPRAADRSGRPDLFFTQQGAPPEALPPDWRPAFVDYLFAAFSTATAFSPTDVVPLTPRAKMMMMLESSISLVTIVVVGARAINVLGS